VFSKIITNNKEMKILFNYIESVAISPRPILITGETGTGKELFAQAIHDLSIEKGPFISINVAGIDDNAFADTLFGHVKGAFTGADTNRSGLVEQASGGTLFLDEIGDLKSDSQIKLLRLLQEREYFTLGSDVPKIMGARIIVATNQDLKARQESGQFRKDLYYRLSSHNVHIPPLRERLDDLPLLLDCFLGEAAVAHGKQKPSFPLELITLLTNYDFPGNIRELKGIVYDAVSTHKTKKMSMFTFKKHITENQSSDIHRETEINNAYNFGFQEFSLPTMEKAQILLMKEAVKRSGNNKSMAAQMLGISRQKLIRHLKKTNQ
jgi:transcriptional regulator with PAS, ATPase and Fis domain